MTRTIDLQFLGTPGVIATAVVPCDGGVLLVDPGPTSCLPALTDGLRGLGLGWPDVRGLLLTHIHLDHAGASGTLAQRWPGLPVYVHAIGARHLAQPERLVASATRLYGDDMARLWGELLAVPVDALHPLAGGESLDLHGRTIEVAYTPGHAVHHVSYFDRTSRTAFVGDTAGVRVDGAPVFAATPPPDIDLTAWLGSLEAIGAWGPASLFLTHFGGYDDAARHLGQFRDTLLQAATAARDLLRTGADDAGLVAQWQAWQRADLRARGGREAAIRAAESAAPFDQIWQGLARYWRKRVEKDGPAALDAAPV